MPESSLYERLGGVFAIAAVVDHFSDAVVQNPIVGQESKNPALREWHTNNLGRLPGLKFMRTLWVCNVAGGPFQYAATKPGSTTLGLEEAHRELEISPDEFDEVAAELGAHPRLLQGARAGEGGSAGGVLGAQDGSNRGIHDCGQGRAVTIRPPSRASSADLGEALGVDQGASVSQAAARTLRWSWHTAHPRLGRTEVRTNVNDSSGSSG